MAKADDKGYKLTYWCEKEKYLGSQVVGNKKTKQRLSFNCEFCGLHLLPSFTEMALMSHGHTKNTINHDLRQVQAL